jgi:hypothetical protein
MAAYAAAIAAVANLGTSLVGSNSQNKAARAAEAQVGLARMLLQQSGSLRAGLLTGAPPPSAIDLAGFVEGGHVQKLNDGLAQLQAAGIDPGTLAQIQGHIDRGEMTKLRQTVLSLPGEGTTAMLPEFFRTGDLPAAIAPRPLAPLVNTYTPAREALEDQFDVAREQLFARSGARGGALLDALRLVETDRAKTVGNLNVDIARQQQAREDQHVLQQNAMRQVLFGQGLALSQGAAPQLLDSYQNASRVFGTLGAIDAQVMANNMAGAGSSLALALKRLGTTTPQTTVPDLGMTGLYNPPTTDFGGASQGGFGAFGL